MELDKKEGMNLKHVDSYRKYLNRITGVLGAFFIFYVTLSALNYVYTEDNNWGRILWHQFYKDRGKIDNVYIGSLHVYQSINTEQLDEINGQYNFNLASGGQQLNGSYYLLKEADRYNLP